MKKNIALLSCLILFSCVEKEKNSNTRIGLDQKKGSTQEDFKKIKVTKLPYGYSQILKNAEFNILDSSVSMQDDSAISFNEVQYNGINSFEACNCTENRYNDENQKYALFRRLQPFNDSIEVFVFKNKTTSNLDLVLFNSVKKVFTDSLNLTDISDRDFSSFKTFYIKEDYSIFIRSFWSYEDDGHENPFLRSSCDYKIRQDGKIVEYFQMKEGPAKVYFTNLGNEGIIEKIIIKKGNLHNHLKEGKWEEKRLDEGFLIVSIRNYINGEKVGKWTVKKYDSANQEINLKSDTLQLRELEVMTIDF